MVNDFNELVTGTLDAHGTIKYLASCALDLEVEFFGAFGGQVHSFQGGIDLIFANEEGTDNDAQLLGATEEIDGGAGDADQLGLQGSYPWATCLVRTS